MAQPVLERRMTAERLSRINRAWQRRDIEELRRFLAPDAVYSPLSGELVRGRDTVTLRFARGFATDGVSEIRFEPPGLWGTRGACRWRLRGRTADGASFSIEGIDLYEFAGDLIRSKDVYQKA